MASSATASSLHHPFRRPPPISASDPRNLKTNHHHHHHSVSRRSLLLLSAASSSPPLLLLPPPSAASEPETHSPPPPPSPAVTDRFYLDFSVCPTYFRSDRPIGGSDPSACPDPEPLGRVVVGLYGKLLPKTVANFKAMCSSGRESRCASYRGSLVHKVLPGQYFSAGRQGRGGEGRPMRPDLQRNTETVDPKSFALRHDRPGTLSLCLSENDDDEAVKMDPDYRNVEFLITTGPAPCPQLDNANIVFGTVLEGMDVVTTIAAIPTYKPAERIRQFNDFAEFLGDERAQIARATWNRPLKTVYISGCGELKVAKPLLSPSLP
ncbi:Peptidyl-prolyl cis-trans isomerase CYP19-4 [Acorus gramineus]|uniref:Peptidyl-prolyl cis-trans isomerase CYP19-4 n=1 Tax=Acorus gramineus TaxID=55184 RepID=A0AAV9B166_ACOGR|nr:Peptidyl-prolyl cis-trans isomerase CYP19-4 [Acorus gramineus]